MTPSAPLHLLAGLMLVLLLVPIAGLLAASSPADLAAGIDHPLFADALWLSLRTSALSLLLIIVLGTPLAWVLATAPPRRRRFLALVVDLPIVIPPAVVGIGLLLALGRSGLDANVAFTTAAVVIAQTIVAAPFYVQSAAAAFRTVNPDLLLVARSLGASRTRTFFRVALPLALPGMASGAALAWGRALGEFGATLLFAGNLPGSTQTMPLAIYTALESDIRLALALALVLGAVAVLLLVGIRALPTLRLRPSRP